MVRRDKVLLANTDNSHKERQKLVHDNKNMQTTTTTFKTTTTEM